MKSKYLPLLVCLLLPIQFIVAAGTNSVSPQVASGSALSGKVIESTNAAGYTYVQVDTGSKKLWAVTTQFPVKVGDSVVMGKGMAMGQYHSKSLDRDFDDVYFADSISVNGSDAGATPALPPGHPPITGAATSALPPGHPSLTTSAAGPNLDFTGIKKVGGGKTIEEIYASKAKLAGTTVLVVGKVVKYNPMILGKNWLHIQDGSGSAGNHDNDLTVTTSTPAAVGDTVLVIGKVSINRDFGAGYKYSVIIEDAKVTVE